MCLYKHTKKSSSALEQLLLRFLARQLSFPDAVLVIPSRFICKDKRQPTPIFSQESNSWAKLLPLQCRQHRRLNICGCIVWIVKYRLQEYLSIKSQYLQILRRQCCLLQCIVVIIDCSVWWQVIKVIDVPTCKDGTGSAPGVSKQLHHLHLHHPFSPCTTDITAIYILKEWL